MRTLRVERVTRMISIRKTGRAHGVHVRCEDRTEDRLVGWMASARCGQRTLPRGTKTSRVLGDTEN